MPTPQKGYKTINWDDVQYRWIMQNQRGVNELIIYACEAVAGQQLIAELPKIVNNRMVTEAIEFANENGWTPHESGKPFRLIRRRNGFELADGKSGGA